MAARASTESPNSDIQSPKPIINYCYCCCCLGLEYGAAVGVFVVVVVGPLQQPLLPAGIHNINSTGNISSTEGNILNYHI